MARSSEREERRGEERRGEERGRGRGRGRKRREGESVAETRAPRNPVRGSNQPKHITYREGIVALNRSN